MFKQLDLPSEETSSGDEKVVSKNKSTYSVVSLFSGCGGMDLGFQGAFRFLGKNYAKQPFQIEWANDFNAAACRTYFKNVGEHIHCGDVWENIENIPSQADVVIGGFPCQDISVNGKGAGVDGKRSGLYRAMVQVVKQLQPKIFVAENVKGLLMRHNASSLERVIKDFTALGYQVQYQLYSAADYGVPQTRERVIIIGTRASKVSFIPPKPTHVAAHITARQAISDLEHMPEDVASSHIWSRASKSAEQGSRHLKADRPGYTIRAECHGNIQFHYDLPRRMSMREAARFQSFPDNFKFDAGLRETERMIGNAVPPVFAWHVANAVKKYLKSN